MYYIEYIQFVNLLVYAILKFRKMTYIDIQAMYIFSIIKLSISHFIETKLFKFLEMKNCDFKNISVKQIFN